MTPLRYCKQEERRVLGRSVYCPLDNGPAQQCGSRMWVVVRNNGCVVGDWVGDPCMLTQHWWHAPVFARELGA
jgi:hypothetical protein